MSDMRANRDPNTARRLELILQQIDALPTLSTVAVRILALAGDPDADVRSVATLIESDPALSARIIAWNRRADLGVRTADLSVQRAVSLMGLDAVRAAMLSIEVFDLFRPLPAEALDNDLQAGQQRATPIDRASLWRHCLAVACAAELLVQNHRDTLNTIKPSEAYICGLLHDLGKLALDALLPRAYARVASISDERASDIADIERRVLGLDHHAAGKRLAEHWGLPHTLQDVMWLHNQPLASLPDLPHRRLVSLITLSDALARQLGIGWSGNHAPLADLRQLCADAGADHSRVEGLYTELHRRVAERAATLGLADEPTRDVVVESIAEANRQLGRLARTLEERAAGADALDKALTAVTGFHARVRERRTLGGAMSEIARSLCTTLDARLCAFVWQERGEPRWLLHRLNSAGNLLDNRSIDPPPGDPIADPDGATPPRATLLEECLPGGRLDIRNAPILGWLARQIGETPTEDGALGLIPLVSAFGPPTVVLHDGRRLDEAMGDSGAAALVATWAGAIAAASQHDGARRLGEKLAEANKRLAEAQSAMVEAHSMARLRELAAGAAHEMNNPLTIISGNSQLLARRHTADTDRQAIGAIVGASEKLSDLITSLHLFAAPPQPRRVPTDLKGVVLRAAQAARARFESMPATKVVAQPLPALEMRFEQPLPAVRIDADQMHQVLVELLLNAYQSTPRTAIEVRVHVDPLDDRLMITVRDDGVGMSQHTIAHAFDPFFSERPAGRGTGLGLARARRLVDLHGGELALTSRPGDGARATIALPDWRARAGTGERPSTQAA